MKYLTSNWNQRNTIRLIVTWIIIVAVMVTYFILMVDYFMIPLLDGYKLLLPEIISNDDSILNRMIAEDIKGVVSEAQVRIDDTDWESMSDTEMAIEINDMLIDVTNVQDSMFEKLWGIILFVLSPLMAIPLLMWFGYKVVMKIAQFLVKVTRLYPKDNPPYTVYWKGKEINLNKKKKKKGISKKFEQVVDEEIDKCSCLYHMNKHIKCDDLCNCRRMKAD